MRCPRCWNECITLNELVRGQCDMCTAQDVEEEREELENE